MRPTSQAGRVGRTARTAANSGRLLERLHGNAGVDTRHTVFPLADYGTLGPAANDRYIEEATALGERALRGALAASGLDARDLDLLIVTSVTGVAVPSLDALLMPRLGLRADVKRLPVFGLGCVAGAAGLARLHDYLLGWPRHTAALLAVELCSLSLPRSSVTTADLVASALFGDGAVALVATGTRARGRAAAGGSRAEAASAARRARAAAGDLDPERGLPRQRRRPRLAARPRRLPHRADGGAGRGGAAAAGRERHRLSRRARPDRRRHRHLDLPSGRAEGPRRRAARAQAARGRACVQPSVARAGRQHVVGVRAAHPGADNCG